MAMNVINFKVGFTKIKSRQQVHQNRRLQQINVQHAKTHYYIIYPLQLNSDCANCNSISALTIKPWLGAEVLFLVSDLTLRLEYEYDLGPWALGVLSGSQGHGVLLAGFLGVRTFH